MRHRQPGRPDRLAAVDHPPGPGQVAGQGHDVLAVLVGQRLAHRRLGPGLDPGHGGRHRAQAEQPEDLTLGPQPGQALAQERVRPSPPDGCTSSTRSPAVGPMPHRAPGARQRDPLVAQGHLGQRPAPAPLAHQVLAGGARRQEHLVERVRAGHVDEGPDRDARARPSGR